MNPNHNPLANQLSCIDFLTPLTPLITTHRLPPFLESLITLKNLMLDSCKMVQKESEAFHTVSFFAFFPSWKQNFIVYHSSKVSDCIFEIHQLWQSGFCWVYSSCCCSCWFEPEIIKISLSSHRCIAITYWIFKSLQFCLYKESLETYWMQYVRFMCFPQALEGHGWMLISTIGLFVSLILIFYNFIPHLTFLDLVSFRFTA